MTFQISEKTTFTSAQGSTAVSTFSACSCPFTVMSSMDDDSCGKTIYDLEFDGLEKIGFGTMRHHQKYTYKNIQKPPKSTTMATYNGTLNEKEN